MSSVWLAQIAQFFRFRRSTDDEYDLNERNLTAPGWRWAGEAPLPLADRSVVFACESVRPPDSAGRANEEMEERGLCVVDAAGAALRKLVLSRGRLTERGLSLLAEDVAAAEPSMLMHGELSRQGGPDVRLATIKLSDGSMTPLELPLCAQERQCSTFNDNARSFGTVQGGT